MRIKLFQNIIDILRGKKHKINENICKPNNCTNACEIEKLRKIKYKKLKQILKEEQINDEGKYSFINKETIEKYQIKDTNNISSHPYCQEALEIIDKYKDGLILDCGAGYRSHYYKNVINYEIANYETTDILGVGEELPFKDNSFDAVFSFAVMEHVTNPNKCMQEIALVLKPNGILVFDACFMQPWHGYPDHYFNITPSGALLLLFNAGLKSKKQWVSDNFHPIYTLKWYLQLWHKALSQNNKIDFENLKIKDILKRPINKAISQEWCNLSETNKYLLCAGTRVIAKKD